MAKRWSAVGALLALAGLSWGAPLAAQPAALAPMEQRVDRVIAGFPATFKTVTGAPQAILSSRTSNCGTEVRTAGGTFRFKWTDERDVPQVYPHSVTGFANRSLASIQGPATEASNRYSANFTELFQALEAYWRVCAFPPPAPVRALPSTPAWTPVVVDDEENRWFIEASTINPMGSSKGVWIRVLLSKREDDGASVVHMWGTLGCDTHKFNAGQEVRLDATGLVVRNGKGGPGWWDVSDTPHEEVLKKVCAPGPAPAAPRLSPSPQVQPALRTEAPRPTPQPAVPESNVAKTDAAERERLQAAQARTLNQEILNRNADVDRRNRAAQDAFAVQQAAHEQAKRDYEERLRLQQQEVAKAAEARAAYERELEEYQRKVNAMGRRP